MQKKKKKGNTGWWKKKKLLNFNCVPDTLHFSSLPSCYYPHFTGDKIEDERS